jgi:HD-GYP domain-containing protein (c-di-GMP phosphodiesterase class II)
MKDDLHNIMLEQDRKQKQAEYDTRRTIMMIAFLRVIEVHEHSIHTARHSDRVGTISHLMGKMLGLPERELTSLWRCGLLHDIGKVGVASDIILSDRKLSPKERKFIRGHPTYGANILKVAPFFKIESLVTEQHHECWDGKGYPNGLKGRDIHLFARIIHVADVFDALVAFRGYKELWDEQTASNFIVKQSGRMFDPDIVKLFLQALETERFQSLYNDPEVYGVYKEVNNENRN